MAKNFTFKTEQPTGAWRAFDMPTHYIKYKREIVGNIVPRLPFRINLMVIKEDINEDGNPNCLWKWIRLNKEFGALDEAKQFLLDNADEILKKYNLHAMEY